MNPAGQPSAAASPARPDPWVGRVVGGRWRILSLLDDSGGMASVYLADDERLPRKAVVKIPKAAQQNAEFRERFAREAHHHAAVENVHVVHILDRGEEAGTPFLVLQYLPGGNLKSWCARSPSILADPRLHYESWLLPIAQALDAVAAKGIVHRDVKPTNILFDADGKGYLSDFGIVKVGGEATMTGTGMFIGTLQFMSPEQCQRESKRAIDGRSDQYGLAVTVYQVLTGWKYPVEDDTAVVYAAKFGHERMTEPQEHDPRVPEAVNDAVMRALSPERDQRFASSVEFAMAVLEGFSAPPSGTASFLAPTTKRRPAPAQPARPTTPRPAEPRRQRVPIRWIVGGLALLGAAAVVGGAMLGTGGTGNDRSAEEKKSVVAAVDPPAVTTPETTSPPVIAPRVTAVEVAGSGPFKAGATVPFVVTFSRPVTVTGSPVIEFEVGDEPAVQRAVFRTGDGTASLTFTFTVPADVEGTGIMLVSPASIDLAGGSIVDAATGKPASLALDPPSSLAGVRIDGVPPRVAKVSPPAGKADRTTGDRLAFRVEFDEPVAVEGRPALSFRAGGRTRQAEFTGVDDNALEFASTVAADDESDDGVTVTGLVLGGGAIRDAAGNAADVAFSSRKSAAFAINARPTPPVAVPKPVKPVPAGPRPGEVETNSIGMQLVVIPAGEFEMGSEETKERLRDDGFTFVDYEKFNCSDESPVHPVRITTPFLMGVHEVTLGEFLKFYHDGYKGRLDCETDGKGGWGYDAANADKPFQQKPQYRPWSWGHPNQTNSHPVVNVSWNDCVAFCEWLSRKEGKRYRLPTEAEWEYACRAGTRTRFWNGNDPDGVTAVGNVADAVAKEKFPWWEGASRRDGHVFTAPVGSFRANPFGLRDMHGNVFEWCSDWHDATYYSTSPSADPKGPVSAGSFRVIRGGSWSSNPVDCRSADRNSGTPTFRNRSVGFRVVCELE